MNMKTSLTQLQISLDGINWTVAGEAKSNVSREMLELKRLEWDLRNKHRKTPGFKLQYAEVKQTKM